MDWQELGVNIGIGIGTGLISGYLSGLYVTSSFNKKEKELQWKRELSEDKQVMYRYLEVVQFELNLIRDKLVNDETVDYSNFLRLLLDEPRTSSIQEEKVTEASLKHILGARNLLKQIKLDIESNTINPDSIKILESKFIRAKFDVLNIKPK